jgi:cell division protein FtsQ
MSEKKKISSKKVLRFSIGAVLVTVFMVALIAASNRQDMDTIKGLEVNLNDDKEFSFLQREDIETLLLTNRNIDLKKTSIGKLDLRLMESVAKTNPWVEQAEIFVDNREILKVNITQRVPVVRLFDVNGGSFYMDSSLHVMPVSAGYAYPLPVFTSVPVLKNDELRNALNSKMVYLAEHIGNDSFWRAQITQIDVQPDQTFVMSTLFGDQKILFGDTTDVANKLSNLLAFYKNISSKIGWDKYQTLDIRFKKQVVASPSVGWVPPKVADTAVGDLEGPPIVTNANVVKPVTPAINQAAKVEKPVEKPIVNKAIVQKKVISKPVTPSKTTLQAKTGAKEKTTAKPKGDKETKSPKYIYQGKKGNH